SEYQSSAQQVGPARPPRVVASNTFATPGVKNLGAPPGTVSSTTTGKSTAQTVSTSIASVSTSCAPSESVARAVITWAPMVESATCNVWPSPLVVPRCPSTSELHTIVPSPRPSSASFVLASKVTRPESTSTATLPSEHCGPADRRVISGGTLGAVAMGQSVSNTGMENSSCHTMTSRSTSTSPRRPPRTSQAGSRATPASKAAYSSRPAETPATPYSMSLPSTPRAASASSSAVNVGGSASASCVRTSMVSQPLPEAYSTPTSRSRLCSTWNSTESSTSPEAVSSTTISGTNTRIAAVIGGSGMRASCTRSSNCSAAVPTRSRFASWFNTNFARKSGCEQKKPEQSRSMTIRGDTNRFPVTTTWSSV